MSNSSDSLNAGSASSAHLSFSVVCCCTRTFFQESAYTNHKRVCQRSRKRLAGALGKAKEIWAEKKRRRLAGSSSQSSESQVVGASDLRPELAVIEEVRHYYRGSKSKSDNSNRLRFASRIQASLSSRLRLPPTHVVWPNGVPEGLSIFLAVSAMIFLNLSQQSRWH
jgi:hypothetical protein